MERDEKNEENGGEGKRRTDREREWSGIKISLR
jgi:hypothetical protein